MNSYSIPNDLIFEILSRLPAKSATRFRCVSKLWASIFERPYFNELFLTKSSAKPHLLFAMVEEGVWSFFSLPQLQNPIYENSSSTNLVVAAEFHVKFSQDNMRIYPRDLEYFSYGYASGLIYLYGDRYVDKPMICNPNTGRYATLPYINGYDKVYSFFMFEPIDKQFKVLVMAYPFGPGHHEILTLGTRDMKRRTIKCSLQHIVESKGICINGVLYYLGDASSCVNDAHDVTSEYVVVCFDVRSENFTFIDVEKFCELINYKGKLAVIYWAVKNELCVWILEDVEKQEWSKYAYTLSDEKFYRRYVSVAGVIATGEIVFSMCEYSSKQPFYVFYFNPEKKNLRRVEIQGFGEAFCRVYTFVDHVEDLNVNDPKLLESFRDSIHGGR